MNSWSTSSDSDVARNASARGAAVQHRRQTRAGRRRWDDPRGGGDERWIPAHGVMITDPAASPAPRALWVEATDSKGELAAWWSDRWWNEALAAWGAASLRLVILPTPGAILLPAVIGRLTRIALAARGWVLAARTYGDGLASTAAIDRLLRSPYQEIEFVLGEETLMPRERGRAGTLPQRTLAVMKELVALREARGQKRPAVVWLWRCGPVTTSAERLAAAGGIARQIRVDRFVLPAWADPRFHAGPSA